MAILGATAVGMGEKLGRIQSMSIFTIIPFPHSHPYRPFPTQGGREPHLVNGFHPQFYMWKITTRLWDHVVYICNMYTHTDYEPRIPRGMPIRGRSLWCPFSGKL